MSGFANSVLGGMSKLIRAAIQSPNYVTGLTGWAVRKDGSAEFNNLTVRGKFDGLDYEINSNGIFFYSGTPAAGNLVTAIARLDGFDAFNNPYFAGYSNYTGNNALDRFATMILDGINWGTNQNGSGGSGHLKFVAPIGINCDTIKVWDPVAGYPTAETWHTLGTLPAGFTITRARFRKTALGETEFDINVTTTAANPGSGAFSVTLPSAYQAAGGGSYSISMVTGRAVTAGDQLPRLGITGGTVTLVSSAAAAVQSLIGVGNMPLD